MGFMCSIVLCTGLDMIVGGIITEGGTGGGIRGGHRFMVRIQDILVRVYIINIIIYTHRIEWRKQMLLLKVKCRIQ
jgi:hypothetical protein